jgi:hypothetical protein
VQLITVMTPITGRPIAVATQPSRPSEWRSCVVSVTTATIAASTTTRPASPSCA